MKEKTLNEDLRELREKYLKCRAFFASSEYQEAIKREKEHFISLGRDAAMGELLENIPSRYKEARVEDFREQNFIHHVLSGGNALLLGGVGIGKTRSLYALSKKIQETAEPYPTGDGTHFPVLSRVITAESLIGKVRLSYSWIDTAISLYGKSPEVLFIDEVDKVKKEEEVRTLCELLNFRYSEKKQTIFSGNGSYEEFLSLYGTQAVSRLTGDKDGGALFVIHGKDKRFQDN